MFTDRAEAGWLLAVRLAHLREADPVVLGVSRGGVAVAFQVARGLEAPLDVIAVRKLGVPFQPELAMGAIAEGGVRVVNEDMLARAEVAEAELAEVEQQEQALLEAQVRRYRQGRSRLRLTGRLVVVVDDGLATGARARAACEAVRAGGAARVVLAVVVAPKGWEASVGPAADELVCLATPTWFFAIGQFYEEFRQVSDDEVADYLQEAARRPGRRKPVARLPVPVGGQGGRLPLAVASPGPGASRRVEIDAEGAHLVGRLEIPTRPRGVVVIAQASSRSRHDAWPRELARSLGEVGMATLLLDLLEPAEEVDRASVCDCPLLGARLAAAACWLASGATGLGELPLGYFASGASAPAALWAAGQASPEVAAVVASTRGGQEILDRLELVPAATLLLVEGGDLAFCRGIEHAAARGAPQRPLAIVLGGRQPFDEQELAVTTRQLACQWFHAHLGNRKA